MYMAADDLADDSGDEKRIEKAERAAERKAARRRKKRSTDILAAKLRSGQLRSPTVLLGAPKPAITLFPHTFQPPTVASKKTLTKVLYGTVAVRVRYCCSTGLLLLQCGSVPLQYC